MSARGTAHRRRARRAGRGAAAPCCWSRPRCSACSSRSSDWPRFRPRAVVDPAGRPGLRPDLLGGVDRRVVGVGGRWVATPDPCAGAGSGSAEHMGLVGAAGGVSRILDAHREHPHPRPTDGTWRGRHDLSGLLGIQLTAGTLALLAGRDRWLGRPARARTIQLPGSRPVGRWARTYRVVVGLAAALGLARRPPTRKLPTCLVQRRWPVAGSPAFAVRMALSTSGALSRDAAAGNGNGRFVDNGSR
jgi:hypothetical protein